MIKAEIGISYIINEYIEKPVFVYLIIFIDPLTLKRVSAIKTGFNCEDQYEIFPYKFSRNRGLMRIDHSIIP